jgi:hypothetical protein
MKLKRKKSTSIGPKDSSPFFRIIGFVFIAALILSYSGISWNIFSSSPRLFASDLMGERILILEKDRTFFKKMKYFIGEISGEKILYTFRIPGIYEKNEYFSRYQEEDKEVFSFTQSSSWFWFKDKEDEIYDMKGLPESVLEDMELMNLSLKKELARIIKEGLEKQNIDFSESEKVFL